MDLEKEERRRDRKVKRMKVKMFVDYPSHLTWSTLGVLSAWSFETRILTMLSKNIKLIFKKSFGHILSYFVLFRTYGISDKHRGGDEIEEVRWLRPAAPAAVLLHHRGRALRGRHGRGQRGRGELHGGRPDWDKYQRHRWYVCKISFLRNIILHTPEPQSDKCWEKREMWALFGKLVASQRVNIRISNAHLQKYSS